MDCGHFWDARASQNPAFSKGASVRHSGKSDFSGGQEPLAALIWR
jgi:hypothetical protein